MTIIIPVLGDQLTPTLPALMQADPQNSVILMMEVMEEASYVPHHPKKIAFLFSAMRHFAVELRDAGWRVDYITLDEEGNSGSFIGEVARAIKRHGAKAIALTEPSEWRVMQDLKGWQAQLNLPVTICPDDRFICSADAFAEWAEGRKSLRMEYFYREMRKKTGLLMDGDKPEGNAWNYDSENRKPAGHDLFMPTPPRFEPDAITRDVLDLVGARFADNFGTLDNYWFGATRADAEQALDHFIEYALAAFGDYQDAMLRGEKFLYHSLLSLYMNVGLLAPLAVCRRVEAAYRCGKVPLNAAEGFIRQIIGWREYVRGIYWREMPDYVERNALDATRDLPAFYWSGDTDMECLRQTIGQTRDEAYAHHIQRLMVTGNFALIAGVDPKQLHEWYLAVYADAFEWVELPNTLGMSQFGDGGLLASKPYASSGGYINKMSDYCGVCRYKVAKKEGANACPFNYLYWDFIARHEARFAKNPRMAMMARSYGKFEDAKKAQIKKDADRFLEKLS
ncbi:MAG: cryptochrome/photolyase family protein [Sphingomonadales bacterium]|nr:cryptochrome/photolyase family protein [Sphingomonadales bacterium]